MENTGYKSFETLERYYTDDNTATGETKPNVVTDPDYIAPFPDIANCPPGARFYNTKQTKTVTRNNCSRGYFGSTITFTANPQQFISSESELDANNQAIAWLENNAQVYANYSGTCTLDVIPPSASILTASSITSNSLILSWTPATDDNGIIGYEIFKNDVLLASTVAEIHKYQVTELSTSTAYNFYVKAKDAAGNSGSSNSLSITTLSSTFILPVTTFAIFENTNSNWADCHNATAAQTIYQNNTVLGAAKDGSQYTLNRYRGIIRTYLLPSKPKSAKLKFRFTENTVGNTLNFNLFKANLSLQSQYFQLTDWDDWGELNFIGSTTVPSNSTGYNEIVLDAEHLDLQRLREGFDFFLISNGDRNNTIPTSNNRPTLSTTPQTGEIYLECEF